MDVGWGMPHRRRPEYPAGSVVEMRVHGVGGEPPSVMTRDPHPVLVTGDEVVGVYRAREPVVRHLEAGVPPGPAPGDGGPGGGDGASDPPGSSDGSGPAGSASARPGPAEGTQPRHDPGRTGRRGRGDEGHSSAPWWKRLARRARRTGDSPRPAARPGSAPSAPTPLAAPTAPADQPPASRDPCRPDPCGPDGDGPVHVREVVSWGGQTSGTWRHALWILLLPFALFNLAGRMHRPGRPGTVHRGVCRALAVTMTLTVVGLACTMGMDLVAMQYPAAACPEPGTDGGQDGDAGADGSEEGAVDAGQDDTAPDPTPADAAADCDPWASAPSWARPFGRWAGDDSGRLALAAILPSLVLILLWAASRYVTTRTTPPTDDTRESVALSEPGFWTNEWGSSRQRSLHVTAGTAWILATLAISIGAPAGDGGWAWDRATALAAGEFVVAALAILVSASPATLREEARRGLGGTMVVLRLVALLPLAWVVAGLLLPGTVAGSGWRWTVGIVSALAIGAWALTHGRSGLSPRARPDASAWPNLLLLAAGLGLGSLWPLLPAVADVGWPPEAGSAWWPNLLPGSGEAVQSTLWGEVFTTAHLPLALLGVLQVLLFVLLLVVSFRRGPAPRRPGSSQLDDGTSVTGNLGAVVLGMLSLFVLVAVGAGLHGLVANLLGTWVIGAPETGQASPPPITDVPLVIAPWLSWSAKVLFGVLVTAGVTVAWVWFRRRVAPAPAAVRDHLDVLYGERGDELLVPDEMLDDDLRGVGRLWTLQRMLRAGTNILLVVVLGGLVTLGSVVAAQFMAPRVWRPLGIPIDVPAAFELSFLDGVSMFAVMALPLAGFALMRYGLSQRGLRKEVARVWDVLTFWPRVTHPFSPPCYAERLVPFVRDRVRHHVQNDSSVVLAGHSQGSMVSLAVAAQLGDLAGPTMASEPGGAGDTPAAAEDGSAGSTGAGLDEQLRTRVALVSYGSPIAILYERNFREPFGTGHLFDAALEHVRTWHHVFGLTEPFAMPFWTVPERGRSPGSGGNVVTALDRRGRDARRDGWPVSLRVPSVFVRCPLCPEAGDAPGTEDGDAPRTVDLLIPDPDVWARADGSLVPALGHSAYRSNPDLDAHLARIADAVRQPPAAAPGGA